VFTTRGADVETVALHEEGHFVGLAHAYANDVNSVMHAAAVNNGTRRALTTDDTNGLNFIYTPDLGDAPDPTTGFNFYQTLVHGSVFDHKLNGVDVFKAALGPEHLF